MSKRTVEIEDSLDERVQNARDEVRDYLLEYLDENPDTHTLPCISNDLDYDGRVHEIVDGCVPIYTAEIEATWFLHASALEGAYEDAGCGDNPRENNGMSAIYFYIAQEVREWYDREAEEIFIEWREAQDKKDAKAAKSKKK